MPAPKGNKYAQGLTNSGRPQTYTPAQIAEMVTDLALYIKTEEDPTIVGFSSSYEKYFITRDYINDHEEFSTLRKKAIEKQEGYLLKGATQNKLNPTFSLFRLKQPQHGYKDRVDTDITTQGDKIAPILVKFLGEE